MAGRRSEDKAAQLDNVKPAKTLLDDFDRNGITLLIPQAAHPEGE